MENVKEEDEENEGVDGDVKPDAIEKQLSEDTVRELNNHNNLFKIYLSLTLKYMYMYL